MNSEDWEGRVVRLDDRRPAPPGVLDRIEDFALVLLALILPALLLAALLALLL